MAIDDAADAAGAAIEGLGQKAEASTAHLNMLALTLQSTTIGSAQGDATIGLEQTRQGLLFHRLVQEGILSDKNFLRLLARELGQRLDSFDLVKALQDAINQGQARPFLAAFERAVFGTNAPSFAASARSR